MELFLRQYDNLKAATNCRKELRVCNRKQMA